MNKETYEDLKELVRIARIELDIKNREDKRFMEKLFKQVENWIDEVAKEYNE